jgi:hypothetical protein
MNEQLTLAEPITVHCFACEHVEIGVTPQDAHDRMEQHYSVRHAALIERLTR